MGRRVIYDRETGDVVHDSGEREGFVTETAIIEDFPDYNPELHAFFKFGHGAGFIPDAAEQIQANKTSILSRIKAVFKS